MTRKIAFNNLGLALGTNLKFCTSVEKGLKLKVREFWGPNPTFVELTRGKTGTGAFLLPPPLNGVKVLLGTIKKQSQLGHSGNRYYNYYSNSS